MDSSLDEADDREHARVVEQTRNVMKVTGLVAVTAFTAPIAAIALVAALLVDPATSEWEGANARRLYWIARAVVLAWLVLAIQTVRVLVRSRSRRVR